MNNQRISEILSQLLEQTREQVLPTVYSATMLAGLQELQSLTAGIEAQRTFARQPAPVNKSVIRDVFLRNGFTIKEGQTDLKPYVYAAAEELLSLDGKAVAAAPAAPVAQKPATWPAAAHNLVRDWQTGMASSNEVCIALASALCGTPPAVEQPDAWTPSGADYDRNIHRNPDAAAWADLFVATFPGLADKHDLMLGWFANAMMAMHDFLKAEQPDAVAVPRELLDSAATWLEVLAPSGGSVEGDVAQDLRALLEKEDEA